MSRVLPAIAALGTTWILEIFDDVPTEKTDETLSLVRLFLADFEAKYSRFKPDSLISTINRTKRLGHPDQTTLTLLAIGQQLYRDTGGVFNILVGEHLTARGYDADYSFTIKDAPGEFPSPLESLSLTQEAIALKTGQLDLGGYGKGFLIDRLAEYLRELGFQYFLINGGGDMYATSNQNEPIEIYLEHPIQTGTYIAKTTLKDQGFAASSTHKRRWQVSSTTYSHIIDTAPESKVSVMDECGVYTKAPSAVLADAWATTLLISPPIRHKIALTQHQIAYARLNSKDNTLTQCPDF